jgi:glycine cleavage system transcriptional repressor
MTGIMKVHLVLTAIGPDRPGIVNDVSEFLLNNGCNIENSRMTTLGGEFVLMLLVSGPADKIASIQREFLPFANQLGLTATAKETPPSPSRPDNEFVPLQVRVVGLDHEGIVHRFAHTLYQLGANIESLETQAVSAPVTGAPMFELTMRVAIPPQVSLSELGSKLQTAGDEVNVDVTVQAA